MLSLDRLPKVSPPGVRTPLRADPEAAILCPVCGAAPLPGRQTVCSPRCRARRHRQRQEAAQRAREEGVRALLVEALRRLEK
ncbi:MAG: DUF2116 family Zn-ribbon domain-containing protein [Candidatus Rokubacteria bacterium]|nr:DUF2116 family Zn-ribbon domain-containing protein [Candidatus Rokubacteria bacterium]